MDTGLDRGRKGGLEIVVYSDITVVGCFCLSSTVKMRIIPMGFDLKPSKNKVRLPTTSTVQFKQV